MGGNNRYNEDGGVFNRNTFYGHDDRVYNNRSSDNTSRSYNDRGKNFTYNKYNDNYTWIRGHSRGRGRGYYGGIATRKFNNRGNQSRLQDGDVHMSDKRQQDDRRQGRQAMYTAGRGGRSKGGFKGYAAGNFAPGGEWRKITLTNMGKYAGEKWNVLSAIKEFVTDDFTPLQFSAENNNLIFYVEGNTKVAKAIFQLSHRVDFDGQKFPIKMSVGTPSISSPQPELLKQILSDRYSVEMNRLDLSSFHNTAVLVKEGIYWPLARAAPANFVVTAIFANIPHVQEIDLSDNRLLSVSEWSHLKDLRNLQGLSLQNNRLRSLEGLYKIKGIGITKVVLDGNPLCDKYKDGTAYTSEVRKVFPKITVLDGTELPAKITFAVDDDVPVLPPYKPSFICSEEVKGIVMQFVEQYYQIYESDDRSPLAAAYTEDACISLSCTIPHHFLPKTSLLLTKNRNLQRDTDRDKVKLLFQGREDVVAILKKLPKATHDGRSFVIDVPMAHPTLIHVNLSGIYRSKDEDKQPIRFFKRSLIIVPVGAGFCICNEAVFFSAATIEQIKGAFKEPKVITSPPTTPGPANTSSPAAAASPVSPGGLEPVQIELIKRFAETTRMLPEYCRMCLEQNGWDFDKSGLMFSSLSADGKIPPEYFGMPPT